MIVDGRAVRMAAGEVVFLPGLPDGGFVAGVKSLHEVVARSTKFFVLAGEFGVVLQVADFRLAVDERLLLDWDDEAKRLVLFEHHAAGPQDLPVHGERIGQPVGFHDACQWRGVVLWAVERARRKQIPSGLGPEQIVEMKRNDAAREVRPAELIGLDSARPRRERPHR